MAAPALGGKVDSKRQRKWQAGVRDGEDGARVEQLGEGLVEVWPGDLLELGWRLKVEILAF